METEIKVGLHNKFDIIKTDVKTGKVIGRYKAENIILNNFWGVFLSANSTKVVQYLHFGSGAMTPVATDIKLGAWLGYKTTTVSRDYADFANGVTKVMATVRLQDAEYVGETIAEVGLSNSTSGTSGLLTKALIKDMNGNVISISKEAGTVIDIFATFFIEHNIDPEVGRLCVGRVSETNSARCGLLDYMSFRSVLKLVDMGYSNYDPDNHSYSVMAGLPSSYLVTATPTITYDVPNKRLNIAFANLNAATGNIGGLKSVVALPDLLIRIPQTGFTQPVLVKEVIGTGDGNTKDFTCAFGYIRNNGTAKVYVNDEEVSATIDYDTPVGQSDISHLLKIVDYQIIDSVLGGLAVNPRIGSTGFGTYANGYVIFENPLYQTSGINSMGYSNTKISVSDDMESWTQLINTSSYGTLNVPAEHRNKRYWKIETVNTKTSYVNNMVSGFDASTLIHLSTAPANGDTVALTYQPDCIAKDANHTLSGVSVTIVFNEYAL